MQWHDLFFQSSGIIRMPAFYHNEIPKSAFSLYLNFKTFILSIYVSWIRSEKKIVGNKYFYAAPKGAIWNKKNSRFPNMLKKEQAISKQMWKALCKISFKIHFHGSGDTCLFHEQKLSQRLQIWNPWELLSYHFILYQFILYQFILYQFIYTYYFILYHIMMLGSKAQLPNIENLIFYSK